MFARISDMTTGLCFKTWTNDSHFYFAAYCILDFEFISVKNGVQGVSTVTSFSSIDTLAKTELDIELMLPLGVDGERAMLPSC